MRVLQIGSDRSKRGILFSGTPAASRQKAYADKFGHLYIIGFSLKSDGAKSYSEGELAVYPTNSVSRLSYGLDAYRIARTLPRPDVVSVQDPFESGLVAWFVAKRLRVPLHVQVHTDFLSPEYAPHSLRNRIRVIIARFVLHRASGIRVVSARIKDSLQAASYKLQATPTILPIFADIERFKNAPPDAALEARFVSFKSKLLVVARLEPEKNVGLAVRAFAESSPLGHSPTGEAKDSCLIIVGGGSERAGLEALAARLGVSHRVFFEGEKDAAPYYALADIALVTSRYEGYGLVIVEALARAVPVLSTDVGVAREAGAIVTTEEKFADALLEWFKSGPRAGELKDYPYKSFDEYVGAYRDNVAACCVPSEKRHNTAQ
ncbi:MAG: glycosyltransferase [Patescibacteria group bacterium]|nr:glycosyltransferase [Patescibacteria group bacterium]